MGYGVWGVENSAVHFWEKGEGRREKNGRAPLGRRATGYPPVGGGFNRAQTATAPYGRALRMPHANSPLHFGEKGEGGWESEKLKVVNVRLP
ncbi:hypothetical protein AGMMS49938_12680 [Fibrobacterales bacterium]|nr:hypothetical protein AGMMS49938_12680 [Fibrobacterales bacterium]